MINLLPPGIKENLTYARRNTLLRHWATIFVMSILGVAVIVVFGLFYIQQSINNLTAEKTKAQASLNVEHLNDTQQQVQDISSSLKLATQVLSREVLFSKLIRQIGAVIPANASLTDLKIAQTQGGIDLTAVASDYSTASQVQVNLQDPTNKIFNKADLISITCGGTNSSNPKYPCTVNIRAQFAKSNPFLFINGDKAGS